MTESQTYEIKCPQCGARREVEIFQIIDAQKAPSLRDRLLENRLNICQCPQCEYAFRIDAPLFYADKDRQAAILCIPAGDESGASDFNADQLREHIQNLYPGGAAENPNIHLVFSHARLVESVCTLEEGMDLRIVEYIKYLIYTRNADRVDPAEKRLLFNAQDSTDETMLFVVQDVESHALEGVLEYKREAYDAFVEMFDDDAYTADLFELFPGPRISARQALLDENADKL